MVDTPREDTPPPDLWEEAPVSAAHDEAALMVDVDGFEGPLDLLLGLARTQKVDLAKISILALADQYLDYIAEVSRLRLEVAADYLVMAAWLAYLKSRLLLPEPTDGTEPTGAELAAALAFRLRRLEAFREAATRLANRNRLGRDVFPRGAPEPIVVNRKPEYTATLYDLLTAYVAQRQRTVTAAAQVRIRKREVWSLGEARMILTRLIGRIADWTPLEVLLAPYAATPKTRRTAIASTLGASLEMVREGKVSMRQTGTFAPIHLRAAERPEIKEVTNG
jgi:segregation and condensation protein A